MVVTLSFNAKMDVANFECNLKTRDSHGLIKVTYLCGNVEGADLKESNQSTTHIDPSDFQKGGKTQAPAYSVSDKGSILCLNNFSVFLTNSPD